MEDNLEEEERYKDIDGKRRKDIKIKMERWGKMEIHLEEEERFKNKDGKRRKYTKINLEEEKRYR